MLSRPTRSAAMFPTLPLTDGGTALRPWQAVPLVRFSPQRLAQRLGLCIIGWMADEQQPTDEALMLAYASGQAAAFEPLYSRHSQRLWRYFFRNTGNAAPVVNDSSAAPVTTAPATVVPAAAAAAASSVAPASVAPVSTGVTTSPVSTTPVQPLNDGFTTKP